MFEVFGGGGFVFALRVLPVIVFFSSLIAVLYYLGIMQFVIRILGGALRAVLKTSRTESLSPRRTSSLARPKRRWWCVLISPP
jgi:CNT family concentrative nucleoside transporter